MQPVNYIMCPKRLIYVPLDCYETFEIPMNETFGIPMRRQRTTNDVISFISCVYTWVPYGVARFVLAAFEYKIFCFITFILSLYHNRFDIDKQIQTKIWYQSHYLVFKSHHISILHKFHACSDENMSSFKHQPVNFANFGVECWWVYIYRFIIPTKH